MCCLNETQVGWCLHFRRFGKSMCSLTEEMQSEYGTEEEYCDVGSETSVKSELA